MALKPSYLKLLNAISVGEGNAHEYFKAWERVTRDDELRPVLHLVAVREGEHALSFEKRIIALGFPVQPRPSAEDEARLRALSDPALSDLAKFDCIGYADGAPNPDEVFDDFFKDHSIDIETGALLGRYIAEERDTSRRLRAARHRLLGQARSDELAA